MVQEVNFFAYSLIGIWVFISIILIFRKWKGKKVYHYVYESIPSLFTTLGIFGTFLGIYVGLQNFDVKDINNSIPTLLEGMKTAFLTSILGIIFSILFGKWSQIVAERAEREESVVEVDEEIEALRQIISTLKENHKQQIAVLQENQKQQTTILQENQKKVDKNHTEVLEILKGGFKNNEKLLIDIKDILKGETSKLVSNTETIRSMLLENQKFLGKKFEEFSAMLAKNNTEALVGVMKKVTEEFNKQMSTLINKLVQENFEELNNSVKQLNSWQLENKAMIVSLTQQFENTAKNFSISADAAKEMSVNTKRLTDDNSNLAKMIKELQKVMIEDTKYQQIVKELTTTINTLKENTSAFDKTTNKLNDWVKNQMNFNEGVAVLIHKLEDVKNVKDINEIFWNNFEKQLNQALTSLNKATTGLSDELENMNSIYYQQLNDMLKNFDSALRRAIDNNRR